jgi:hypothetical protein
MVAEQSSHSHPRVREANQAAIMSLPKQRLLSLASIRCSTVCSFPVPLKRRQNGPTGLLRSKCGPLWWAENLGEARRGTATGPAFASSRLGQLCSTTENSESAVANSLVP